LLIGILGGSFNPAHLGHLYISLEAMKRLGLTQVWWLVSPQNPLKPKEGMAPFAERLEGAKIIAKHPKIQVLDIEKKFGTSYTYDTLRRLKSRYPEHKFILIMGADNFAELPRWRRWREIFALAPIVVFNRDAFFPPIMVGKPAVYFRNYRKFKDISRVPGWTFFAIGKKAISATKIRQAGRKPLTGH